MDTLIKVKRKWFTDQSTIGELYFDNSTERICFTLEDRLRDAKIQNETCIPAGKYEVVLSFSNRFKKLLPLLVNVPNYEGVRIHSGNTNADTSACILVGLEKGSDVVFYSRRAFTILFEKIRTAMEFGKLFIEISNDFISDVRTK